MAGLCDQGITARDMGSGKLDAKISVCKSTTSHLAEIQKNIKQIYPF